MQNLENARFNKFLDHKLLGINSANQQSSDIPQIGKGKKRAATGQPTGDIVIDEKAVKERTISAVSASHEHRVRGATLFLFNDTLFNLAAYPSLSNIYIVLGSSNTAQLTIDLSGVDPSKVIILKLVKNNFKYTKGHSAAPIIINIFDSSRGVVLRAYKIDQSIESYKLFSRPDHCEYLHVLP